MKLKSEREMLANTVLKDGDCKSIRDMLERVKKYYPNNNVLAELNEENQIVYYTVNDLYEEVMNLGDGLIAAGFEGAHIAIVYHEKLQQNKFICSFSAILMASIILSTMFLKQHSVFDVITAFIVAFVMYQLVYVLSFSKKMAKEKIVTTHS